MALEIVHYNDPVLRRKGSKINVFDAALGAFANEMIDALHAAHGIGLAAQQVGRAIQLCVVDLRASDKEFDWSLDGGRPPLELFMPMVIANPKVTVQRGLPQVDFEEGCLSFPEIRGNVPRVESVSVRFQDQNGVAHHLECTGLFARCIQHEVDHLNGVLFIDRMDSEVRAGLEEPMKALAKRTREARTAKVGSP